MSVCFIGYPFPELGSTSPIRRRRYFELARDVLLYRVDAKVYAHSSIFSICRLGAFLDTIQGYPSQKDRGREAGQRNSTGSHS
jgi:hypothetical protein